MGCCRGRRRQTTPMLNEPAPCKALEQGGAGLKFWVTNGQGGPILVVKVGAGSSRFEINSYLSSNGCSGPTARTIQSNIGHVISAIRLNQAAFRQHANGISLVDLIRTADTVHRSQRSRQNAALRPNSRK